MDWYALEDAVCHWFTVRREKRWRARERAHHTFRPRKYYEGKSLTPSYDDRQCGFCLRDDGLSDPDYCNHPPEWHTRGTKR